jgi:hypothetical protein
VSSPATRAEELLAYAARHVPWWREALGGGRERVAAARWSELPTMDRALIGERFDDLVADRAVRREAALAHYRSRPGEPMAGGVRVFLSAGAHGEPVPLLYDEGMWAAYVRSLRAALAAVGAEGGRVALVGSDDLAHTLGRLQELASPGLAVPIGLQDGVGRACERLEELQPDAVYGIASAIALVAELRPRIAPVAVLTGTDALDEDGRELVEEAFGATPRVSYGLTELGLVAVECRHGGDLHVHEENVLLEQTEGRTYATNLVNRIQPMIRLHLPERVELRRAPCACGGSPLRLRLHGGRASAAWRVPGAGGGTVALHPIVLRSALDPLVLPRLPEVRWTGDELHVALDAGSTATAERRLRTALARAGADPRILAVVLRD